MIQFLKHYAKSLLVVLVSLGASYLVHYGFDLPVTGWLRRRTRPAGRDAAAGSERSSL